MAIIQKSSREIVDIIKEAMKMDESELVEKAVHGDSLDEQEAAMAVYEGREVENMSELRKDAEHDMELVLKEFESFKSQIIRKGNESEAEIEAKTWSLRKDLWERYSMLGRILSS